LKKLPLTLELASPGLPKQSWVKISQIQTLSVERIGKKVAEASPEELTQVIEGLNKDRGLISLLVPRLILPDFFQAALTRSFLPLKMRF